VVGDAGRDGLLVAGAEAGHVTVGVERHRPVEHPQHAPGAVGHEVGPAQARRERVGVEGAGGASEDEPLGELEAVAERALERRPEATGSTGAGGGPLPGPDRRTMADVLAVEARQLGDPVALVVLVEPLDPALHRQTRRPRVTRRRW
jgi:hypothetical protein